MWGGLERRGRDSNPRYRGKPVCRFSKPDETSENPSKSAISEVTPTVAPTVDCIDPDLAAVAAAWPSLPAAVKASILAMVAAAEPRTEGAGR